MHIVAIVGKSGSNLAEMLAELNIGKVEIFDFAREREKLLEPGEEGYRQVINYFGEEFLYKDGWLNLAKFWKFVYQDYHKLRIFEFLMEPLLFNQLHKREKASGRHGGLIFLPGLVDLALYKTFNSVIWLDLPKDQLILNLNNVEKPLVAAEKMCEIEEKLFPKPEHPMIVCKSKEELIKQVEKWLTFV